MRFRLDDQNIDLSIGVCDSCEEEVHRYRGEDDVICSCGAWDDDIGDLEGMEMMYHDDE